MDFEKEKSRFYKKDENGALIAEIDYSLEDDGCICIDSTFVDDDYRGQGIAEQLVDTIVAMAREENRKIDPQCPYAKSLFKKHPGRYFDIKK